MLRRGSRAAYYHVTSADTEDEEKPVPPGLAILTNQRESNQGSGILKLFRHRFQPAQRQSEALFCSPSHPTLSNCCRAPRPPIFHLTYFIFRTCDNAVAVYFQPKCAPCAPEAVLCCRHQQPSKHGLCCDPRPSVRCHRAAGVKLANREVAGPTATLALVAKAGPRHQPFPGFSDALEQFAFKSTLKRSALRINREVELLGGEVSSTHSRENVVLKAKFLSNDLPYFAELLAEVASQSKFAAHELNEVVIKHLKLRQQALAANPEQQAVDAAHALAFHRGLGESITPSTTTPFEKYLSAEALAEFAQQAYAKSNIALVGSGSNSADLSKWVGQFFKELPSSGSSSQYQLQPGAASKYHGGEQRISSKAGNAVVIAFPGSAAFGTSGYKPEASVLAALLGGFSQVRASTKSHTYSDAGLFTISLSGKADHVASASKNAVDALKKVAAGEVASEDIKKAIALAKFRALESAQNLETGLEATGSALLSGGKLTRSAKSLKALTPLRRPRLRMLQRTSSLARPPSPLLETSSSFLTARTLV
ncbi:ubiquinol-cytochrome C reductase complex core protein 2 [Aspergillus nomiae NRRL 13137]|uniref:Cytochrome b-c1 complex subunit 2, mitochondrial n=1 Tax=Aspergillus nomiae NRRL (strain ATCC 15546 / NRRL 13137 / CBS 260.88 / M93) TaxID=1509407 RepID=A0A0L1IRP8_ASPN3|nr:ubiquinol-cytochrome C reductase complex core protein 2 [Aspergillus nomiae NRRL 13137]KNG82162.1 ubiquinol-cytochrome C reductase complex core protein 2 [Aspergillus nomiae NRRL 13137]